MVHTEDADSDENPRRLIVMSEKHAGEAPWLLGAYDVSQETPFTFSSISQFNCKPNRGGDDKSFFIVNHWLRPERAARSGGGGEGELEEGPHRATAELHRRRQQLPNAVAVDFTAVGDMYKTVNLFNAAVARQSGVTPDRQRDGPPARARRERSPRPS